MHRPLMRFSHGRPGEPPRGHKLAETYHVPALLADELIPDRTPFVPKRRVADRSAAASNELPEGF